MEETLLNLNKKYSFIQNIHEDDKERFKSIIDWAGKMMDLTIKERIVKGTITPKRGEVWVCDLGENVGCEENKIRPVIIMSNDIGNSKGPTVMVVPISNKKCKPLPIHLELKDDDFVDKENNDISGKALAEQIRAVSKARLGKKIGELTDSSLKKLELCILISLGMNQ